METILKALNLLRVAQAELNKMIEKSLANSKYNEVKELAGLADGVAELLRDKPTADAATRTIRPVTHRVMKERSAYGPDGGDKSWNPPLPRKVKAKPKKKSKSKSKSVPSGYPRFERDENRLVKLGWSKKNQKPYEHRVPREVLGSFVDHLTTVVDDGQVFEVESLLPAEDQNGDEIPAYQIYVTLAWLRESGAIEKKGRDGYVLRDGSLATGGVEKYWNALPLRSV